MDRPTRVKKKDRTGVWISVGAHVGGIVIALIILSQTEMGKQALDKIMGTTRDRQKQEERPKPPPAAPRSTGPRKALDAPPPSGGPRRAADAPPPTGESFFTEERKESKTRSGGSGGGTNVQQRVAPPAPPKILLKPSAFTAPKTDIKQLLVERQKATILGESFGTEQISKSGASDVSDIVGRISGASLAEGKFAVVRGLSDRYTITTLNGADIPSADPNRRAVQLDLFPAQFISKVDVSKTFQPDLPGGFAGGAINIVTRSFPDRPMFSFSAGTSYNTQASLRDDYLITDQGGMDWLAMDDGKRELPGIAAATSSSGNQSLGEPIKDSFGSRQFGPVEGNSPLNSSMSLAFGDTTHLFGRRLGFVAGLNYKNDYNFYDDGMTAKYSAVHPTNTAGVNQSWTKTDARAVIEYTWGSIATLAYEPFENHELGFNFIYVQTAEDEARQIRGRDSSLTSPDSDPDVNYVEQNVLHWTERNLTYFQLQGKHDFPDLRGLHMDWVGSLGSTSQDEPDYRIFSFSAQPGDPNDPNDDFYGASGPTEPSEPTRFFRSLEEDNVNFRADWTLPMASYNSQENSVKAGISVSQSEQTLTSRAFTVRAGNSPPHPFRFNGDVNSYLAQTNNSRLTYLNFPANFNYVGEQTIGAWYGMGTWSATEWLRMVGGVRVESTDIAVDTQNITQGDTPSAFSSGEIKQKDLLPALSATIALRTNLQLRLAWSQTVVRPTYREISAAQNYDIALGRTISGNPNLTMSAIENYDARLEWYPRPGELISVGVFMKRIDEAIEQAASTTDNENIFYDNYERADVFGIEVELRKNFRGFLGAPVDQFSLGFNYAYIKSTVDLTEEQIRNRSGYGETLRERPLYDQPEFVVNGDLTWDHFGWGTSITVNGGVTGRRLVLVGLGTPDEYEEPAPYLDVSLSQKIGRNWKAKLSAKNLLDPVYEVTQTWPSIGTVPIKSYKKGMSFGVSLGCDF